MHTRLDQWIRFLSIDESVRTTLNELAPILERHLDSVLDAIYDKICSNPSTRKMFSSPESLRRAREAQRRHWLNFVFAGNFNDDYLNATRSIGQTHYRLGVDLRFYMGTYTLVMGELAQVVLKSFPDDVATQHRYLSALSRANALDMGLSTTVYYDAQVEALQQMANELNFALARAGEFRDNETGRHLVRMSRMCQALALEIGKDLHWAQMIQIASPLHDVGKIGIPDNILLKPGRLTPEELAIMRTHPDIGATIIPDHPAEVIKMARRISLTHHERWDGTGYPAGLRGKEIPLEGRIATICDVYDALVSVRPYKEAWPQEKAVQYLKDNSGLAFDPVLVDAFLQMLPQVEVIQRQFADDAETEHLLEME
ncbi:protoglobin domain-containing protein [Noviherbaspirillum sp.]|uniref:protoglobin domain-containing protein n=1 Tax=Noviherbaspirillum sp. TaxID=1926288 RepID=UPI002D61044E|nr:protoglobin domain-containing protein [Noviherbaspirillum sp.]HZW20359.1 protoglobin domain-containing protein [Noviherbaspirillum sp.]